MSRFAIVPTSWIRSRTLSPLDKLVLAVLGTYTNDQRWCRPSVATIAEHSGVTERSVRRSLQALREAGAILVDERHAPDGTQMPNGYWVTGFDQQVEGEGSPVPERDEPYPHSVENPVEKRGGRVTPVSGGDDTGVRGRVTQVSGEQYQLNSTSRERAPRAPRAPREPRETARPRPAAGDEPSPWSAHPDHQRALVDAWIEFAGRDRTLIARLLKAGAACYALHTNPNAVMTAMHTLVRSAGAGSGARFLRHKPEEVLQHTKALIDRLTSESRPTSAELTIAACKLLHWSDPAWKD